VTTILIAALALVLAINTLVTDAETKRAGLTHAHGQMLEVGGHSLQVVDEGPRRGVPVVLLHCYLCSLHSWASVAERLRTEARVVRIDLLGFGGSQKSRSGYSVEEQARYVAAVMGRLGIAKAVVVGNSYGAGIATALAEAHPGRVSGVGVVDMAPDLDYGDRPLLQTLSYTPVLGQLIRRLTPAGQVEKTINERMFSADFDAESAYPERDRVMKDFDATTYTSYKQTADLYETYTEERPLSDRLAVVGKPVLVLFGSEDRTFPAQRSIEGYRGVMGVQSVMVKGAGHLPQVEQPGPVAAALRAFVKRASAGR
jgi:pimeloyl-ACP methyl ester carboxylesterase